MRINSTIEIGPLSNYSLTDFPGWARYYTAGEFFNLCRQPDGVIDGVRYSEELEALVLDYGDLNQYLQAVPETVNDYVTVVNGTVTTSDVPGKVRHLWFPHAAVYNHTEVTSKAMLPADPSIILSIVRYPDAATNQARVNWFFSFGEGYWVEYSTDLFLVVGTPDGSEYTMYVDDTEKATFLKTFEWETYIYVEGDKLVVVPTWSNRSFVVREPNGNDWNIPAALWSWESHAGPHVLNVSAPQFQITPTAYMETPWIDLGCAYDDETFVSQSYPDLTDPTSPFLSTISVIETDETGTQKRFGITLASTDETRTPFLRGVQMVFPPTQTEPVEDWLDITCFVQDWSLSLSNTMQPAQATLSIHLLKEDEGYTFSDALVETFGSGLWGKWAVRIAIGYEYDDESTEGYTMLTGVIDLNSSNHSIDITNEILQVTCFDRLALMATRDFWYAPCVLDMTVANALSWWALWCGIPVEDQDVTDNGRMVNDLATGYSNPPWRPEYGTKGIELMKQLADRRGYRVYFTGEGRLQIEPRAFTGTPVAAYTSEDSSDRWYAIQSLDVAQDMGEAVGMVVVRGNKEQLTREARLDPELAYVLADPTATVFPGETYTGIRQTQTIADTNLMSQSEVEVAAWEAYIWRKSGAPTITLTPALGGWTLLPNDHITVTDSWHGFTDREFRVTNIELRPEAHAVIRASIQAEAVLT